MTTSSITFNSISEIPGWVASHPQVTPGNDSTSCDSSMDWDLNVNLTKALEIAKKGGNWEEGGKLVKETTLSMANLRRTGRVPSLDTDVCGFLPDVPAYLAGDPSCMWNEGEEDGEVAPILSIGVGVRAPGGFTSRQKINYGAAILSVIDEIEDSGVRVELWAVYANESCEDKTDFRVLIKAAEENWSPNSAAFALCHPAYHRRIMFRLAESFRELSRFTESYGRGYDIRGEFDVWIPALTHDDQGWSNSQAASLKHTTKLVERQLTQQEKAA
jgi:hypothetical protein